MQKKNKTNDVSACQQGWADSRRGQTRRCALCSDEGRQGCRGGVVQGDGGGQLYAKSGADRVSQLHGAQRVQARLHQRLVGRHLSPSTNIFLMQTCKTKSPMSTCMQAWRKVLLMRLTAVFVGGAPEGRACSSQCP